MAKSKSTEPPALSEAQLEIMQIVWQGDEVTVTVVWSELAKRRAVARNTVLTLMDRLEKKGWLKRRAEGQTHYYRAASSRCSTPGFQSSNVWSKLPSGALQKGWCLPCWKDEESRTRKQAASVN